MNIGDMARKVAGVFVELPEDAEENTGAEKNRTEEKAAGNTPALPADSSSASAPVTAGAQTPGLSAVHPLPPVTETQPAPTESAEQLLRDMGLIDDHEGTLPLTGSSSSVPVSVSSSGTPHVGVSPVADSAAATPEPSSFSSGSFTPPAATPPAPLSGRQETPMPTPEAVLDPPTPVVSPIPPVGATDVTAIYSAARIVSPAFTAEQMLEMLASMPNELPLSSQRQMMTVTLNAISKTLGATPSSIASDASAKIAALTSYVDNQANQITRLTSDAEHRIAGLQAQIEEIQRASDSARRQQAQTEQMCAQERERLASVLSFFGYDESHRPAPTQMKAAESPSMETPPSEENTSLAVPPPASKETGDEEKPLW